MFTETELQSIDNENPNTNILMKLTSLTDSIRETSMKLDVLEVLKTTEVFVDYDDTYLHFSTSKTFFPGENGTYLQPTSLSPKIRDNFLQNYPDIQKGLGGRKLKNWLVRTRPTDIVHVVDNDGLFDGIDDFSLLVVGKDHVGHGCIDHNSVIGPDMSPSWYQEGNTLFDIFPLHLFFSKNKN